MWLTLIHYCSQPLFCCIWIYDSFNSSWSMLQNLPCLIQCIISNACQSMLNTKYLIPYEMFRTLWRWLSWLTSGDKVDQNLSFVYLWHGADVNRIVCSFMKKLGIFTKPSPTHSLSSLSQCEANLIHKAALLVELLWLPFFLILQPTHTIGSLYQHKSK